MKSNKKQKGTTAKVALFLKDVLKRTENKSMILGDTILTLTKIHHISNSYSAKLLVNMGILETAIHEKTKYYKKAVSENISDDELNDFADKLHQVIYEYKHASKVNLKKKRETEANIQQKEINFENDTVTVYKNDDDYPTLLDIFKETIVQLNLEKADLEIKLEDANKSKLELRNKIARLEAIIKRKDELHVAIIDTLTKNGLLIMELHDEFESIVKTNK